MSVLEIRHEFFDVDARNNEQVYQAFCNHVYLGQWELCRLCLEILFHKRLQLNTNIEDLLIDIVRHPTVYWCERAHLHAARCSIQFFLFVF